MNNKFRKSICGMIAIYVLFLLWVGASSALAQETSGTLPSVEVSEVVKPGVAEQAMNFVYAIYNGLTKALSFLFEQSIFKEYPELAEFYGQIASFLIAITALYLILLLVTAAKKVVGLLLIIGWALFIVTLVIRAL
jgi:hypothetical protein